MELLLHAVVEHRFLVVGNVEDADHTSSLESNDIPCFSVDLEANFDGSFDDEEDLLDFFNSSEKHGASWLCSRLKLGQNLNHHLSISLVFPVVKHTLTHQFTCGHFWDPEILCLERFNEVCEQEFSVKLVLNRMRQSLHKGLVCFGEKG